MRGKVFRYIRRSGLVKAGNRLLMAVSGGADSVALLRVMLELRDDLGIVPAVAHFNHGLRGEDSEADEYFVAELARRHELPFLVHRDRVAEYAAAERVSLELAGRELRYEWLTDVALEHGFDAVATAHSRDDQAETVLMKFLRGAGSRGLAGIYPVMTRGAATVRFIRPLLTTTRTEIELYLESLPQEWREDGSNFDRRFFRNRVRHDLLPLLEREYNPNLREALSCSAEINREEEEYWDEVVYSALQKVRSGQCQLRLCEFEQLSAAVQRRMLKRFLEEENVACDLQHVEAIRRCALGEFSRVELPSNRVVCREADCLVLKAQQKDLAASGYSYAVTVPGEVKLTEIGCTLRFVLAPSSFAAEASPGTLLRADAIGDAVCVRNWLPGDRYQAAYTGKEHKLKTLFLERKIPVSERLLWPVVLKDANIVWVCDLPVAEAYCWRPGDADALRVECIPL